MSFLLRNQSVRPILTAAVVLLAIGDGSPSKLRAEDLVDGPPASQLSNMDSQWNRELDELAKRCEALQRPQLAARTRLWQRFRTAKSTVFYLLNAQPDVEAPAGDNTAKFWQRRLNDLRKARGAELFRFAQQVATVQPAMAYQLCHEVVHLDPDHAAARGVLGYQKSNGQWHAAGGAPSSSAERANSRIGVDKHQRIRTRHFEILSEPGEAQGQALAAEIETVYAGWSQLFFPLWSDGTTLQRRMAAGESAAPPLRRHRVVLFRDRERYLDALRRKESRIGVSVGLYLPDDRTSYFYWDDNSPPRRTWRHEVTHQLFSEVRRAAPNAGLRRNFWLIEGIAMYMESVQGRGDRGVVGGPGVDRLQFARLRRAPDRESLQPLLEMGRGEMQRNPSLSELYSNAAGVTCFLMDGEGGRHRSACIGLLQLVYQGRDDSDSLLRLTGYTVDELVQKYHAFLADVTDADLAGLTDVHNLCLRGTKVTGAGLGRLDASNLEWLDVAGLALTDGMLQPVLEQAKSLRQLNLEATHVTDKLLVPRPKESLLDRWPRLVELDLSQTEISDVGLKHLAPLNLEVLWLTKTQVTAASVPVLAKMMKLSLLDVVGLGFDQAAVEQLKKSLPQLKQFQH